jgi:hypothetical protein
MSIREKGVMRETKGYLGRQGAVIIEKGVLF